MIDEIMKPPVREQWNTDRARFSVACGREDREEPIDFTGLEGKRCRVLYASSVSAYLLELRSLFPITTSTRSLGGSARLVYTEIEVRVFLYPEPAELYRYQGRHVVLSAII